MSELFSGLFVRVLVRVSVESRRAEQSSVLEEDDPQETGTCLDCCSSRLFPTLLAFPLRDRVVFPPLLLLCHLCCARLSPVLSKTSLLCNYTGLPFIPKDTEG